MPRTPACRRIASRAGRPAVTRVADAISVEVAGPVTDTSNYHTTWCADRQDIPLGTRSDNTHIHIYTYICARARVCVCVYERT